MKFSKMFNWVNGPSRAVVLAAIVVLLVLFGREVMSSMSLRAEIHELEHRKEGLLESLASDSVMLRRLNDPAFLEQFARENYLMRRAGEVVYVVD